MTNKSNIVLCGFMGSGKSTVGRLVSKKTGKTFIDLDKYIEEKSLMSVSEIFENYGEEEFRNRESAACVELSSRVNHVIATGGGTILRKKNKFMLSETGIIIYLDISPETVLLRLENDKSRPLLHGGDKKNTVLKLISERVPIYRESADLIIDASGSPRAVCNAIIKNARSFY